jgi:hypothetical protein
MGYYTYEDWTTGVVDTVQHSGTSSFWLPADVCWSGAAGTMDGVVDDTSYLIRFWYKGESDFSLYLGRNLKYDLVNDPDEIVPEDATADEEGIHWRLKADDWTQFTYIYKQGSWLADSGLTGPVNLEYDFVGVLDDTTLVGYVDDIFMGMIGDFGKPDDTPFTLSTDTLSATIPPLAARWELPAAEDWTEKKIRWTNPASDIGGNLTMFINNDLIDFPDYISPEKPEFDLDNAGWTFFDDFVYQIAEPTGIKKVKQGDLHIYPNPAVDVLYLSIQDQLRRIDIYNSMGQLVKSIDNSERKIDISDLNPGMYMLNVTDMGDTVYKSKFIKK